MTWRMTVRWTTWWMLQLDSSISWVPAKGFDIVYLPVAKAMSVKDRFRPSSINFKAGVGVIRSIARMITKVPSAVPFICTFGRLFSINWPVGVRGMNPICSYCFNWEASQRPCSNICNRYWVPRLSFPHMQHYLDVAIHPRVHPLTLSVACHYPISR